MAMEIHNIINSKQNVKTKMAVSVFLFHSNFIIYQWKMLK